MSSSIVATVSSIALKAGRWPIQTLALISAAVFVVYVLVMELKHVSLAGSLARSFFVRAADSWTPLDHPGALRATATGGAPRFVGAPLSFPANASRAMLDYVGQVLGAAPAGLPSDSQLVHAVVPEQHYAKVLADLSLFSAGAQQWQLRSAPSWLIYFKVYAARLADNIHASSWFDLGIVGLGWAGMYYTFAQLFLSMRSLGSRTYLFLAALISSLLAFLTAYAVVLLLGFAVPKLALVQGVPFFVLVIGFNNKVDVVREALRLLLSDDPTASKMGAAEAVQSAVAALIGKFFYDAAVEAVGVLLIGWSTALGNLREFSLLSALTILLDLAYLVTFFAANVSLKLAMIRVERSDAIRRALQEDGVAQDAADAYANTVLRPSAKARAAQFTHFRWLGGSARLVAAYVFLVVNLLYLTNFPVSFTIDKADLAPVSLAQFHVEDLPMPCVLTIVPPLRFAQANRSSVILNSIFSHLSSASAIRISLSALFVSLVLNGYLVSIVMRHDGSVVQRKVPVVVTVPSPRTGSPAPKDDSQQQLLQPPLSSSLDAAAPHSADGTTPLPAAKHRTPEDCEAVLKAGLAPSLTDEELVDLCLRGKLPLYALEKHLKDTTRAVVVRRAAVSRSSRTKTLEASELPWKDYNYDRVLGACCENVVGYLPLPLGMAGPVLIDGEEVFLPMATTEGVLVASTMRGCKALNAGGGVTTQILADGMTRGPCVTFSTAARTAACKLYLDSDEGRRNMERAFNSTSRFAKLDSLKAAQAGVFLYIRFRAQTGDAMGMNMISKGTERALQVLAEECGFEDMTIVSVSGNYCTDKKASAINWIEGRGKSVVAEALVPGDFVTKVLKTGVDELVELNIAKNLVGSAMAGVMGGYNAHAANLVAAVFLATGQDPAQVVEGSNCMTLMSNVDGDLQISVTMPSLEVGTVGGGTILEPQAAMLNMLGVRGPHLTAPGENARKLARIVATAVLAGELSLNAALAAGHLVRSHMQHNRAKPAPVQA